MDDDIDEMERLDALAYVTAEHDLAINDSAIEASLVFRQVFGRISHSVWAVTTQLGRRYWVVTNPTASYDMERVDCWQAVYMHVGMNVVLALEGSSSCPYAES